MPNESSKGKFKSAFREKFSSTKERIWAKKSLRKKLHHSFKRSHREDYARNLEAPGLLYFAMTTLKFIFKRWKLFGSLLVVIVFLNIFLVGLMSESTYTTFQDTLNDTNESLSSGQLGQTAKAGLLLISTITTGGLTQGMTEVQQVFAIILFIVVWLVTIYLIRHILAGNHPKLRDGLYNALSPLISSLMVFLILFLHMLPIFIVVITYSVAVSTEFLATPFYALTLLSCYLLPGSLLGLVAASAPGMYPLAAINAATDLIAGRRTKFIIRLVFMIFFLAIIWVIVMMPIILLDMAIKGSLDWTTGVPIVPFFLLVMTVFSFIYFSAYVYLFYRRMLDDPN